MENRRIPGNPRFAALCASRNSCSRPDLTRKRTALNAVIPTPAGWPIKSGRVKSTPRQHHGQSSIPAFRWRKLLETGVFATVEEIAAAGVPRSLGDWGSRGQISSLRPALSRYPDIEFSGLGNTGVTPQDV